MNASDQKIHIMLSEHQTALLLALIQLQSEESVSVWKPYWVNLAHTIEQSVKQISQNLNKKQPPIEGSESESMYPA